MTPSTKIVSFFDLDGTLRRGYMITEFPEHLAALGMFDKQNLQAISDAARRYHSGQISYRDAGIAVANAYAQGIRGKKRANVALEAEKFVKGTRDKLMPFAEALVDTMLGVGSNILLSGSPQELVRYFSEILDFDSYAGSIFGAVNGVYDGTVRNNRILGEEKMKAFQRFAADMEIDADSSFAFGDTEEDLPILQSVGHGFAINPSPELAEAAKINGIVCVSGDNVMAVVGTKLKELSAL